MAKALEAGGAAFTPLHNHPEADERLISRLKAGGGLLHVEPSPFLERFAQKNGGKVEAVYALLFVIFPACLSFHTKARRDIAVDLYIFEQVGG